MAPLGGLGAAAPEEHEEMVIPYHDRMSTRPFGQGEVFELKSGSQRRENIPKKGQHMLFLGVLGVLKGGGCSWVFIKHTKGCSCWGHFFWFLSFLLLARGETTRLIKVFEVHPVFFHVSIEHMNPQKD